MKENCYNGYMNQGRQQSLNSYLDDQSQNHNTSFSSFSVELFQQQQLGEMTAQNHLASLKQQCALIIKNRKQLLKNQRQESMNSSYLLNPSVSNHGGSKILNISQINQSEIVSHLSSQIRPFHRLTNDQGSCSNFSHDSIDDNSQLRLHHNGTSQILIDNNHDESQLSESSQASFNSIKSSGINQFESKNSQYSITMKHAEPCNQTLQGISGKIDQSSGEQQRHSKKFFQNRKQSCELKEMSFQNPFFVGASGTGQSSSIQSKANIQLANHQQLSQSDEVVIPSAHSFEDLASSTYVIGQHDSSKTVFRGIFQSNNNTTQQFQNMQSKGYDNVLQEQDLNNNIYSNPSSNYSHTDPRFQLHHYQEENNENAQLQASFPLNLAMNQKTSSFMVGQFNQSKQSQKDSKVLTQKQTHGHEDSTLQQDIEANSVLIHEDLTFQDNIKDDDCYLSYLPLQKPKEISSREVDFQMQPYGHATGRTTNFGTVIGSPAEPNRMSNLNEHNQDNDDCTSNTNTHTSIVNAQEQFLLISQPYQDAQSSPYLKQKLQETIRLNSQQRQLSETISCRRPIKLDTQKNHDSAISKEEASLLKELKKIDQQLKCINPQRNLFNQTQLESSTLNLQHLSAIDSFIRRRNESFERTNQTMTQDAYHQSPENDQSNQTIQESFVSMTSNSGSRKKRAPPKQLKCTMQPTSATKITLTQETIQNVYDTSGSIENQPVRQPPMPHPQPHVQESSYHDDGLRMKVEMLGDLQTHRQHHSLNINSNQFDRMAQFVKHNFDVDVIKESVNEDCGRTTRTHNRSEQRKLTTQNDQQIVQKSKKEMSVERFLKRQQDWLSKRQEKLIKKKVETEIERENLQFEECTFVPQITSKCRREANSFIQKVNHTPTRENRGRSCITKSEEKVEDRLISWEQRSKIKMRQVKNEISKEREKECTFKPALSPKVQKIKALQRLKQKTQSTDQKTPRKTPRSQRGNSVIKEEREDFNPVQFFKRNLEWRNKVERKKKSIVDELNKHESIEATFKPQISRLSQAIHDRKLEKLKLQQSSQGSQYYQLSGQILKDTEKENLSPTGAKTSKNNERKFIGDKSKATKTPAAATKTLVDLEKEKQEFTSIIKELKNKLQSAQLNLVDMSRHSSEKEVILSPFQQYIRNGGSVCDQTFSQELEKSTFNNEEFFTCKETGQFKLNNYLPENNRYNQNTTLSDQEMIDYTQRVSKDNNPLINQSYSMIGQGRDIRSSDVTEIAKYDHLITCNQKFPQSTKYRQELDSISDKKRTVFEDLKNLNLRLKQTISGQSQVSAKPNLDSEGSIYHSMA